MNQISSFFLSGKDILLVGESGLRAVSTLSLASHSMGWLCFAAYPWPKKDILTQNLDLHRYQFETVHYWMKLGWFFANSVPFHLIFPLTYGIYVQSAQSTLRKRKDTLFIHSLACNILLFTFPFHCYVETLHPPY